MLLRQIQTNNQSKSKLSIVKIDKNFVRNIEDVYFSCNRLDNLQIIPGRKKFFGFISSVYAHIFVVNLFSKKVNPFSGK